MRVRLQVGDYHVGFDIGRSKKAPYDVIFPETHTHGISTDEGSLDGLPAAELYRRLATVYACVFAISNSAAQVGYKLFRDRKGSPEEITDHDILRPLRTPNPFDSEYDVKEATYSFLDLTGDAYWLMEGGRAQDFGPPEEIHVLKPWRVKPQPDPEMRVSGYSYEKEGRKRSFTWQEVIHFRYFSPTKDLLGQGSMEAGTLAAISELYSIEFNNNFFKNGATLAGVLKSEDDIPPATMKRLLDDFNRDHRGAHKAWKVKGLSSGLDFKEIQQSHKDMLFAELRQVNREEILMVYGVPPVILTLLDGATYNNATEQVGQFWKTTMLPKMKKQIARLNLDYTPRWGEPGLRLAYDLAGVEALRGNLEMIGKICDAMFDRSSLTPNEYRLAITSAEIPALEPLEAEVGDQVYGSLNRLPLSEILGSDEDEGEDEGGEEEVETDESEESQDDFGDAIDRMIREVQTRATEPEKVLLWRRFDRKARAIQKAMIPVMRGIFRVQERQLLAQLEELLERAAVPVGGANGDWPKRGVEETALVFDSLFKESSAKYRAMFGAAVENVGKEVMASLPGVEAEFSLIHPGVVEFMDDHAAKQVVGIDKRTQQKIATSLNEGLANGEGILGLSDRVKGVFKEAKRSRALTIARTESTRAFNYGHLTAYQQSGVVDKKEWISNRDETTRGQDPDDEFTHYDAFPDGPDGEQVAINNSFEGTGEALNYPGDAGGSAGNVINCRCTIRPVVKGENDD